MHRLAWPAPRTLLRASTPRRLSFLPNPCNSQLNRCYFQPRRQPNWLHQGMASRPLSSARPIEVKLCAALEARTVPEYVGSPHLKLHNVVWRLPLQNIYVVKKPWNDQVTRSMVQFINHVHLEYPALNVMVSEDVAHELETVYAAEPSQTKHTVYTGSVADIVSKTDLIVTLGGDGTILRAVLAFSNDIVPPVLSFAMGTLGFLLPFDFATFKDTFRTVYELRSKALHRTRLECHVVRHREAERPDEFIEYELAHYKQHHNATMLYAMNDVSLHRGLQPNLIKLDIYIDSEFLTSTTADGLIFATPTGSTAYSLSSGGSIAHPLVPCILLTPVCPRSLSFRPLVLPLTSHIMIRLAGGNRNGLIKMNIDGIPQLDLMPGDEIHVVNENGTIYIPGNYQPPRTLLSRREFDDYIEPGANRQTRDMASAQVPKGIFCIAKTENDWTRGINELLGFNRTFRGPAA